MATSYADKDLNKLYKLFTRLLRTKPLDAFRAISTALEDESLRRSNAKDEALFASLSHREQEAEYQKTLAEFHAFMAANYEGVTSIERHRLKAGLENVPPATVEELDPPIPLIGKRKSKKS
jgi:hypothetical protein